MDLRTALEIGKKRGLTNVGDSIHNIKIKIGKTVTLEQYRELVADYKKQKASLGDDLNYWIKKLM